MSTKNETETKEKITLELPGKYNVIIHNDNVTPFGFVIEILVNIFKYDREKAAELAYDIHDKGKGIAGTYIKSIAEAKVVLVRDVALKSNYPLSITLEKA